MNDAGNERENNIAAEFPGLYCESCGGKDFSHILANMLHRYSKENLPATWRYSLVKCTDCGMAFIAPRPKWSLLESFYPKDYGCYVTNILDPEKEAQSLKYRIARFRFANYRRRNTLGSCQVALAFMVEVLTGRTLSYTWASHSNLSEMHALWMWGLDRVTGCLV